MTLPGGVGIQGVCPGSLNASHCVMVPAATSDHGDTAFHRKRTGIANQLNCKLVQRNMGMGDGMRRLQSIADSGKYTYRIQVGTSMAGTHNSSLSNLKKGEAPDNAPQSHDFGSPCHLIPLPVSDCLHFLNFPPAKPSSSPIAALLGHSQAAQMSLLS